MDPSTVQVLEPVPLCEPVYPREVEAVIAYVMSEATVEWKEASPWAMA